MPKQEVMAAQGRGVEARVAHPLREGSERDEGVSMPNGQTVRRPPYRSHNGTGEMTRG